MQEAWGDGVFIEYLTAKFGYVGNSLQRPYPVSHVSTWRFPYSLSAGFFLCRVISALVALAVISVFSLLTFQTMGRWCSAFVSSLRYS